MKTKLLALASVAALGFMAPAQAAIVVDVNGKNNATIDSPQNPAKFKTVFLGQGRYVFSFTQGAYTAHNRFGGAVNGCEGDSGCTRGWETNVRWIIGNDTANVFKMGDFGPDKVNGPYYRTSALAFAASSAFSQNVTIGAGGSNVSFYIFDPQTNDNVGGVSVLAAGVPEPATWAMMIMGFGLIGGAYRSRRTQGTVRFA